jgi:hypothetical protein
MTVQSSDVNRHLSGEANKANAEQTEDKTVSSGDDRFEQVRS